MTLNSLLTLCFTAVLAENAVFVRLFGADALRSRKNTALIGGAMIPVTALSALVCSIVYNSLLLPLGVSYLKTVVFALVCAFFAKGAEAVYTVIRKEKVSFMPIVTLNCTLLGVMLLNANSALGAVDSLFNGLFYALGFAFALFLYNGVEQRIRLANPPEAFEGAPLTLIAAGLVAMVFMGFSGIEFGGGFFPFKLS